MGSDSVVQPIKVELKADVTDACSELAKATPKGFAKVTHLLFGKRDCDVARHKALTAAQTEVDIQKILAGQLEYRDGELKVVAFSQLSLESQFLLHEAEQELLNVAGNARIALETLKDVPDDQISDEEVSPDFFARWRREAKMIGDKDLQELWGKLLAEEVKAPKSISYRALDVIKNLSPYEAQLFMKIAPYVVGEVFPCMPGRNKYPGGINTGELFCLDEAGLIIHGSGVVKKNSGVAMIDGESSVFLECSNIAIGEFRYGNEISVQGLKITATGIQILSLYDMGLGYDRIGTLWGEIGEYIKPQNGFFRFYELQKDKCVNEPICEIDRS